LTLAKLGMLSSPFQIKRNVILKSEINLNSEASRLIFFRRVFFFTHVPRGWVVVGKGNKQRFVDIPTILYDEIMHFKEYYGSSEHLFPNRSGESISLNHVGRICKEAAKAAGVPKFHPHAARHYRTVELDS